MLTPFTEHSRLSRRAKMIVVAGTKKCGAPNYATFLSDFLEEGMKLKELRQIMERKYKKPDLDGVVWG